MSKMSVRVLLAILLVFVAMAHGQILNRRQPFNLVRQQLELQRQQQEDAAALERQSNAQLLLPGGAAAAADNPAPVNRATFERLFEAIRMINELLQTLSAIRARFSSDTTQQAQVASIPTYFNSNINNQ